MDILPALAPDPNGPEPIFLAEAKAFLRVEHADEDPLILDLIRAARQRVEMQIGRALVDVERRETLLAPFPRERVSAQGRISLSPSPLLVLRGLTLHSGDREPILIDPADPANAPDRVRVVSDPAAIVLNWTQDRLALARSDRIEIVAVYGYGGLGNVPPALRDAILRLVAQNYESRGLIRDTPDAEWAAQIAPFQIWRL